MVARVLHPSTKGSVVRSLRRNLRPLAARAAAILLAGNVLAECAASETPLGTASAPTAPAPSASTHDDASIMNAPQSLLEAAIDDAAQRTGAPRADIKVMVAEAVTWPDGSLGCPQPGMLYTQALVPGYRIVLRVGEATLNYHATAQGPPRFCPADRVVPPLAAAADPSI